MRKPTRIPTIVLMAGFMLASLPIGTTQATPYQVTKETPNSKREASEQRSRLNQILALPDPAERRRLLKEEGFENDQTFEMQGADYRAGLDCITLNPSRKFIEHINRCNYPIRFRYHNSQPVFTVKANDSVVLNKAQATSGNNFAPAECRPPATPYHLQGGEGVCLVEGRRTSEYCSDNDWYLDNATGFDKLPEETQAMLIESQNSFIALMEADGISPPPRSDCDARNQEMYDAQLRE